MLYIFKVGYSVVKCWGYMYFIDILQLEYFNRGILEN